MADLVTSSTTSTPEASTAASTETLLTPAAQTPGTETLLTPSTENPPADAAKTGANADLTKNADGTPKTADQIAAEKAEADKAKTGAPEKYTDFKAPEGVTLSPESLTQFSTIAKELNISQENAQKLVDLAAKNHTDAVAANLRAWNDKRVEWRQEVEKDPVYGGAKMKESVNHAVFAKNTIGKDIPGLEDVFKTGWGDNPALFKFFVEVGRKLGESKAHSGGAPTVEQKSAAQLFYSK